MKLVFFLVFLSWVNIVFGQNQHTNHWVVTDALGRNLPGYEEVGPLKKDRKVGVFYYVWAGFHDNTVYDITKILQMYPNDPLSPDNPGWGKKGEFHFWGEPEQGYYRSEDPWVIRRDLQMLSNANVDFIFFDVTNSYTYPETVKAVCEVSVAMRRQGIPTPEICFLTNSGSGKTMNKIYDEFYSKELFKELWFYWEGKPLIMGKTDDPILRQEIRDFFTLKYSWAWSNTQTEPNHWQWLDKYPQDWGWSDQPSKPEQITVSLAHHPQNPLGKSFHDGSQPEVDKNYLTKFTGLGFQAEEQWSRALEVGPEVVMVTQWNEWLAQRFIWEKNDGSYAGLPIKKGDTYFVDVFTAEFNRDMAPMKNGYTDNYYYQLFSNIRKYKGMEKPEPFSLPKTIKTDADFEDWKSVEPAFKDPVGDVMHRDFPGYDTTVRLVNFTGRNDIVLSKATYDKQHVYFYAETAKSLTSTGDSLWMLLFLDTDKNMETGWEGYDFVINNRVVSENKSTLKKWTGKGWGNEKQIEIAIKDNKLEMVVSRKELGFAEKTPEFYFKWADNPVHLTDVASFFVNGDTAPDRRFKYDFKGQE